MPTRRRFVQGMGAAWLAAHAAAIVAAAEHAQHAAAAADSGAAPALNTLTSAQARDIEAIAACIVPSGDDGPGAREAGALYFIDRALGTFFAGQRADIVRGLAALPRPFADLDAAAQIETLRTIEGKPLFESLRFLTVLGLFSSPDYGGNRGELGWQLLGFDDTHAYQPPFGYYDRDYPGFQMPEKQS